MKVLLLLFFFFNLRTTAFKAYCAIWVRRSNFRHQAFPRVSLWESTQRRKVELWAINVWEFCLNADLHVTFRDLLHAVKLRHGTDGFPSEGKECWGFFRPKNPKASTGCEPANLGTRINVTCISACRQYDRTFFAHSSTFRRWVLSRGDTCGDAWWRKLERLTRIAK
jgi:hypothetical protein